MTKHLLLVLRSPPARHCRMPTIQLEAQLLTAAPLPADQQQLAAAVLHVKPCAGGGGDGAAAVVSAKPPARSAVWQPCAE